MGNSRILQHFCAPGALPAPEGASHLQPGISNPRAFVQRLSLRALLIFSRGFPIRSPFSQGGPSGLLAFVLSFRVDHQEP
jgi:hypothetical protein